jgi:hypothetical protein
MCPTLGAAAAACVSASDNDIPHRKSFLDHGARKELD